MHFNEVSKDDFVGKTLRSRSNNEFEIVEYISCNNVRIRFKETGYECSYPMGEIRKGYVKDKSKATVLGVGIIGDKYPSRVRGKPTKEYRIWFDMLNRCYGSDYQNRNPTYKGCSVSANFKSYEYFYEWCQNQVGFNEPTFQLDKDILFKHNKEYSENTCCFVPNKINALFIKRSNFRGKYALGVYFNKHKNKYLARLNKGKSVFLGYFSSENQAFNAYKLAKESYIKELANKYKASIAPKVYSALINYQVEFND